MNTRSQDRKKKIMEKNRKSQAQEEIIDIEEIKEVKIPKNKKKKENKEKKEHSSSNIASPNKKGPKRKKNKNGLAEVMEIDNPEVDSILIKRNVSPPAPMAPKENNQKKNGKKSVNSTSKTNNKKAKKSKDKININLDENDDNNNLNVIKLNKEGKNMPIDNKNKKGNKSPYVQNKKVKKDRKNNKNGKNIKEKDEEEKEKEIIQYNIYSSEDNEKEKENNPKIQNKHRKRKKIESTNKISNKDKNGYSSSIIEGPKRKKNIEIKIGPNSSSKIFDDNPLKGNINKFLGKKRKHENLNQSSISPNKEKYKSEIKKAKTISQIKSRKHETKSSTKSFTKLSAENNNNLLIPKMNKDNHDSNKKSVIPELAVLEQLFTEYGFDKVLDSLYKPNLGHNKLDTCLQGLKKSCSNDKLPIILFKIFYSYFETKIEEIKNNYKRATSANNLTSRKKYFKNEEIDKSPQKSKDSDITSKNNDSPGKNEEKEKIGPIKSEKKLSKKNKSENPKSPNKEEKKSEKMTKSIGSHYHKDKEGNIYKYQVCNLDGKGNAIFKCYDDKCEGMGIYGINTMSFSVIKIHNLKYEEHDYIIDQNSDDENMFKEFENNNKSNAQVFKENGQKVIKFN